MKTRICGGTIYNDNTVITAAHCIIDRNTEEVISANDCLVYAGSVDRSSDRMICYEVQKIWPHPYYSLFSLENDIGLIKVSLFTTFFHLPSEQFSLY